jgi:hypothetical protein
MRVTAQGDPPKTAIDLLFDYLLFDVMMIGFVSNSVAILQLRNVQMG